jgi:4a-hydroxytetrahydrobiopterin dehydratase
MKNSNLANQSCVPCQGGQIPMDKDSEIEMLTELGAQWRLNDQGHLTKSFKFKNFIEAMNFANKIADLAEKEGHHPDLMISWGLCSVEIWTHKINGLAPSDFILAAKIEAIN